MFFSRSSSSFSSSSPSSLPLLLRFFKHSFTSPPSPLPVYVNSVKSPFKDGLSLRTATFSLSSRFVMPTGVPRKMTDNCSDLLIASGEDAVLGRTDEESRSMFMAIADGVGGYRGECDPGIVPRALLSKMEAAWLEKGPFDKLEDCTLLRDLVVSSLLDMRKEDSQMKGATTISAQVFSFVVAGRPSMSTYTLGDSGWVLFRQDPPTDYRAKLVVEATSLPTPNKSRFEAPPQLSPDPSRSVSPHYGIAQSLLLLPGDIVINASDGLWDNLSLDQITELIAHLGEEKETNLPYALASSLSLLSRKQASDPSSITPISKLISPDARGGKLDDVSVSVTMVRSDNLFKVRGY